MVSRPLLLVWLLSSALLCSAHEHTHYVGGPGLSVIDESADDEEEWIAEEPEPGEVDPPGEEECSHSELMREDEFFQGYLQAMIDMQYSEFRVRVVVHGSTVYLSHLPANRLTANSIIRFVHDFPGVKKVVVEPRCIMRTRARLPCPRCRVKGIWFPQSDELFAPLIADPRQISFSAAWRFHDDVFGSGVGAVSFGNPFGIFRWLDIGPWHGDLQIGIEGGVWAVFKMDSEHTANDGDVAALLNSDYYVGVPITYACGNWSYRLRWYHISSHLGDEFMIIYPDVKRLNPSREAIDLFASYQLTQAIRLYGGIGINYNSNHSFPIKPLYFEYGAELHLLGGRNFYHCLYWQPFLAMNFRNWQDLKFEFDASYALGIEVSRVSGMGRKVRLFMEYHDGFSLEGQFSKMRTNYFALRVMFGF